MIDSVQNYFDEVKVMLDRIDQQPIERAIERLHQARLSRQKIFIMGNGGSASTASHFVCDLAKNTRAADYPDFRVIGLSDNMGLMTAYANDEGYENVFVMQMASLIDAGDVVIGISTSGNSPNVLQAISYANQVGATTIGFTGFNAGQLGDLVDIQLHVPSDCIEQVEDIHLLFEHLITKALRERILQPAVSYTVGFEAKVISLNGT
jgi:D-sedoheptulose 7-phosphate isomerase